jgi:hypothetical protein
VGKYYSIGLELGTSVHLLWNDRPLEHLTDNRRTLSAIVWTGKFRPGAEGFDKQGTLRTQCTLHLGLVEKYHIILPCSHERDIYTH